MIVQVSLSRIQDNPWQTRQQEPTNETVKELAMDIVQNGLMQTPVGRLVGLPETMTNVDPVVQLAKFEAAMVQLAFGHTRLRAFCWIFDAQGTSNIVGNWSTMPVEIRPLTDQQMADFAWSENEKRRQHTPLDRALAIQRRIQDFGWSQAEVADHLGISRPVVSNSLRLLRLPDQVHQALADGQISERMAIALLSLYELPEGLLKQAEADTASYYSYRPSSITKQALAGELGSDQIRQRVDSIVNSNTNDFAHAPFKLDDEVPGVGIISPTCRDCPMRMRERNVCMNGACFDAKGTLYRRRQIEPAADASGILVIEDERVDSNYAHFRSEHYAQKAVAAQCPNLRLRYNPDPPRVNERSARVHGHPHAEYVCGKKEQYCTCMQAFKATGGFTQVSPKATETITEERPATDAEELKEIARQARRDRKEALANVDEIVDQASALIAKALLSWDVHTWQALAQMMGHGMYRKDRGIKEIVADVAHSMANRRKPEEYQVQNMGDVYRPLNRLLQECGLGEMGTSKSAPPGAQPSKTQAESGA